MKTATLLMVLGMAVILYSRELTKLSYPPAPVVNQVDDYHGMKISDPHRTLEDADAPETRKWVEEENQLTFSYLTKLPGRDTIKARLTGLWNYEKFGAVHKAGSRYFLTHNSGLQNQSVVFVMDSLDATPRVLLDPNTYRADGTAAISGQSVSWDGNLFAYGVAQAGSDWAEWHIRDVRTGKDLPDLIRWTKGTIPAWTATNDGFYYERYPEPRAGELLTVANRNQKIYFHELGTNQATDRFIYGVADHPDWLIDSETSEDGRYLIIAVEPGDSGKNLLYYLDLSAPDSKVATLVDEVKFSYQVMGAEGPVFYVMTTDGASRRRLIAMDVTHPDRGNWKEIVPERAETLAAARLVGGKLLLNYMKDAHSAAYLVTTEGKPVLDISLPGLGTAAWSQTRRGDSEAFYSFATLLAPAALYRLDVSSGKSAIFRESRIDFASADYEVKQVFYKSKDGTRVPMFLGYRKGLKLDGQNPTLLYGYGGFNIALTPQFSVPFAEWMQMGGIIAVANLRGGSEYGEDWHVAGTKANKQNVFDDFIAAGEWLIANHYTSTPKLAIHGGSNGGLLVGAVLNQRPDLFGAAMPAVGVMDMLRFQKFGFGAAWMGDYGSPDNPEDFKAIRAYSPLHNIRKGVQYPPTLITTSDHDDRVMPGHSLKYAAALQEAQEGPAPILIRIETRAGHGAGKPTSKQIDEWADRFVFLEHALGMTK